MMSSVLVTDLHVSSWASKGPVFAHAGSDSACVQTQRWDVPVFEEHGC